MGIGISPLVDYAFKKLLGNPEHPRVTTHFLNALFEGQPRITKVQFLNPFLEKESESDKLSVLDILATDEHGRLLNIEMQTTLPIGLSQRLTYYASSLYASQLQEGNDYSELRPAINICVLARSMFPDIPKLHLDFRLRESSGKSLNDDLQIHLLELPKLNVTAQNVASASPIERWAYFLLNAETMTIEDVVRLFPDYEFREAMGVLIMIQNTPAQRFLYDAREKFRRDEAWRIEASIKEGLQLGLAQGLVEGRAEGLAEGLAEGEAKGELRGRIKILQKLLSITEPGADQLATLELDHLSQLADQLEQRLLG